MLAQATVQYAPHPVAMINLVPDPSAVHLEPAAASESWSAAASTSAADPAAAVAARCAHDVLKMIEDTVEAAARDHPPPTPDADLDTWWLDDLTLALAGFAANGVRLGVRRP